MDRDQFLNHWGRLYGRYTEDLWVEMRPITAPAQWFRLTEGEKAADAAAALTEAGHSVYLGVTPRVKRKGGKANVAAARVIWADYDAGQLPEGTTPENAVEFVHSRADGLGIPRPSAVVWSGRGVHAYWNLSEPLETGPMGEFLKVWALALGSDRGAVGSERIMRAPGTVNQKNGVACRALHTAPWEPSVGPEDLDSVPGIEDLRGAATAPYEAPAEGEVFEEGERHSRLLATLCAEFRALSKLGPLAVETAHTLALGLAAKHAPGYAEKERADFEAMVKDAHALIMSDAASEATVEEREDFSMSAADFTPQTTPMDAYEAMAAALAPTVKFTGAEWIRWSPAEGIWVQGTHEGPISRIGAVIENLAMEASEGWANGTEKQTFRSLFRGWGKASRSTMAQHTAALEDMPGPHRITPLDTNRAPRVLVCGDGSYVDLTTGQQRKKDPALVMTRKAAVEYDGTATCPQWDRFMRQMIPCDTEREYLARWMLYCLTADTGLRAVLVNKGAGANGKSVAWSCIEELLGDLGQRLDAGVLRRNDSAHNSNRLAMRDRRLTRIEEGGGTEVDPEALKDISGGERHYEGRYAGAPRTVKVQMVNKIIINVNGAPDLQMRDAAVRARVVIFPWRVRVADLKVQPDPMLREKLLGELPGILNWIMREGRGLWANGLTGAAIPESIRRYTASTVKQCDPLFDAVYRTVRVSRGQRMTYGEIRQLFSSSGVSMDTRVSAQYLLQLIREVHADNPHIEKVRTITEPQRQQQEIIGVYWDRDRFMDFDEVVNYDKAPEGAEEFSLGGLIG